MRQAREEGRSVSVASITLFDLWYGIAKGERAEENAERLHVLLDGGVEILTFETEDAERAGVLRAQLERAGTPIGPYDLLIAAQAVRTGRTLITANVREFSRVPDLTWENWSAPEGDAGQ